MDAEVVVEEHVEPERYFPSALRPETIRDEYVVKFGTWEQMKGDLLSQLVHDAGSIRRAAKAIDVPKSTLAAWVKWSVTRGIWRQ